MARNYIKDAGFELGALTTFWIITGDTTGTVTLDSTNQRSGTYCMKQANGVGEICKVYQDIDCYPAVGETWTLQAYIKKDIAGTCRLSIRELDANGAEIPSMITTVDINVGTTYALYTVSRTIQDERCRKLRILLRNEVASSIAYFDDVNLVLPAGYLPTLPKLANVRVVKLDDFFHTYKQDRQDVILQNISLAGICDTIKIRHEIEYEIGANYLSEEVYRKLQNLFYDLRAGNAFDILKFGDQFYKDTLAAAATAGDTTITVNSVAGLQVGDILVIEDAYSTKYELVKVQNITDGTTQVITLEQPLQRSFASGTPVLHYDFLNGYQLVEQPTLERMDVANIYYLLTMRVRKYRS